MKETKILIYPYQGGIEEIEIEAEEESTATKTEGQEKFVNDIRILPSKHG